MIVPFRKLFLDTAPVVYYLDDNERYADVVQNFIFASFVNGIEVLTSVITATEYLTHPYRNKDEERISTFFEFIAKSKISIVPIDLVIAEKAAQIRADYPNFKTMDSLQLATALTNDCDAFLTNDKQLVQFSGLHCITVDSL